ncbi:hypothetical protein RRG08_051669 [Elysia crispata]|uniref:Uncharacterized protein n=1 Tax=Elysia crispata TaxID=231223 RepID=A0AAE1A4A4_9GAST|nr:hypothetical protein RRG08_051669 [Elysia crispata]
METYGADNYCDSNNYNVFLLGDAWVNTPEAVRSVERVASGSLSRRGYLPCPGSRDLSVMSPGTDVVGVAERDVNSSQHIF